MSRDRDIGDPEKRIPPEKIQQAKGTMRWVKARQCATVYKNGKRAGQRCSWTAVEGKEKCKKHIGPGVDNSNPVLRRAGHVRWIARMRELQKTQPDIFKRDGRGRSKEDATEHWRLQRAAGITSPVLVPLKDIPGVKLPTTDDKVILKADRVIRQEIAALPTVPDKPFGELEPHEQLVVITGRALNVVHEILHFEMKGKDGVVDVKVASMVKDTALRALAVRVKIDSNALREKRIDKMDDLLRRLKAGDGAKVIEG